MATAAKRQATSLRRQVKKLFYEFDETGDGAIDPGELKSFATRLGHTWTKDQLGVARRILGASYDKTGEGNPIRLDDLLGFFSKASHLDDAIRSVSSQLNDDSSDYESSEMDDGEEDTPEVRLRAHPRRLVRKRGVRSIAPPNTLSLTRAPAPSLTPIRSPLISSGLLPSSLALPRPAPSPHSQHLDKHELAGLVDPPSPGAPMPGRGGAWTSAAAELAVKSGKAGAGGSGARNGGDGDGGGGGGRGEAANDVGDDSGGLLPFTEEIEDQLRLKEIGLNPARFVGSVRGTLQPAGRTWVHFCAVRGESLLLGRLLDAGAHAEVVDWSGQTAMHLAASCGSNECVGMLLDRGARVSLKDEQGNTPAHVAADMGHEDILTFLLDIGFADPDVQGPSDYTPLHLACQRGTSLPCVEILLRHRADINLQVTYIVHSAQCTVHSA